MLFFIQRLRLTFRNHFSSLPFVMHVPPVSSALNGNLIVFGEEYRLWSSSLCNFIQPHATFSLTQSMFIPQGQGPSFKPKKRDKIIVCVYNALYLFRCERNQGLDEKYKLWSSSLRNFIHHHATFSLYDPYVLSILFSHIHNLCLHLRARDQVSNPRTQIKL
jgi:hypothetical protein